MNPILQQKIDESLLRHCYTEQASGLKLYEFTANGTNLSIDREMFARSWVWANSEMKVTPDEITMQLEAVMGILRNRTAKPEKKEFDAYTLVSNLLTLVKADTNPLVAYKHAALLILDETESPLAVDENYLREKISRWAKEPEIIPFVLARSSVSGITSGLESPEVFLNSMEVLEKTLKRNRFGMMALDLVLNSYNETILTDGQRKSLQWQMETLEASEQSVNLLLASISTFAEIGSENTSND